MEINTEPFIFKLQNTNLNDDIKYDIILSSSINQSLISLGYHYFLNRLKNDMIQHTKNLKTDNKFYFVINPFEMNIQNYEDNINKMTSIYLNKKDNKDYPRSFYKTWEMLYLFDLTKIDLTEINLTKIEKKQFKI